MTDPLTDSGLEQKFCRFDDGVVITDGTEIEGYASLFDQPDQGNDVVAPGAYGASLQRLAAARRRVKLLWQHDPAQPSASGTRCARMTAGCSSRDVS